MTVAAEAVPTASRPESRTPVVARLRNAPWGLVLALLALAFFLLSAVVPQWIAPFAPTAEDLSAALEAPNAAHLFGTDAAGRDLFSRVVWGTRESLLIGVGAAALALVLAVLLGSLASLADRFTRAVADRVIEISFAIPTLLLALVFVAILGPSAGTEVLAIGISTTPGYARMVRGQILGARDSGYVEAARALGHGSARITARHILPNAMRPLVAVFTMAIGQTIVWASALAFLGLGVAPPSSEWGALLDAGRTYVLSAGWLTFLPGLAIIVLAVSATTVGKHIQARLEGTE